MMSPPQHLTGRKDDRDRPVRVLDAAAAADWPAAGDQRIALLVQRMQTASTPSVWVRAAFGAVAILIIIGAILGSRVLFPSAPRWAHMVGLIILMMGWGSVVTRYRNRMAAAQLAELLIEEGLCPQCGYNLLGLDADRGGMLSCPECGAGWRAERIRRTAAFEPGARMADANTVVAIGSVPWACRDDRGRRRPMVHPRLRKELAGTAGEDDRARILRARAGIARSGRIVRWAVAFVLIGAGLALGTAMWVWRNAAAGFVQYLSLIPALLFVGLGLGALFGNFCYSAKRVRGEMLKEGLCPSCAASLAGLEAEADGRVVCRGCLGAWALSAGAATTTVNSGIASRPAGIEPGIKGRATDV